MSRKINLNGNRSVTVVEEYSNTSISQEDSDMDTRAKEAVKGAVNRAKVCKKPIAKYDKINKKAYIETPEGERIYAH